MKTHVGARTGRRDFLKRVVGAGAAGAAGWLLGPGAADAQAPPETTRIRIAWRGGLCQAPKLIADDLLRAEGFSDLQYPQRNGTVTSRMKALGSGETDFDLLFAPDLIVAQEAGHPFVVLAGGHIGCFELFGGDRVRAVRDLRGKNVGVREVGVAEHTFATVVLSYIGLDAARDVRWVVHPNADAARRLTEGQVDAWLGFPPTPQELRAKGIGRVLINSTTDPPWRQYFCCMVAGNREFVRRHPVATKRVLRALMKANQLCAVDPEGAARLLVGRDDSVSYQSVLQTMRDIPYALWREYDPAATVQFYALRLHEAGRIRSTPQKVLASGTDWRFLNELRAELKG